MGVVWGVVFAVGAAGEVCERSGRVFSRSKRLLRTYRHTTHVNTQLLALATSSDRLGSHILLYTYSRVCTPPIHDT